MATNTSPRGGIPDSVQRLLIASAGPPGSHSVGDKTMTSTAFASAFLSGDMDEFSKSKGKEGRKKIRMKTKEHEAKPGTSVTPLGKPKKNRRRSRRKKKRTGQESEKEYA